MNEFSTSDALPGGSIQYSPDPATALYMGSLVDMTVTLTMAANGEGLQPALPANAAINISSDNAYVIWPPSRPVPVTPIDQEGKVGTARFILAVYSQFISGNTVKVDASVTGVNVQLTSVEYDTQPAITARITDPSRVVARTAIRGEEDETIQATVFIHKGDVDETPVANYLVNWAQEWDVGLFENVEAYASAVDLAGGVNKLETLYRSPGNKQGFVLTKTDASGKAHLFLKPTGQQVFFQLKTTANLNHPEPFAPVSIYNYRMPDLDLDAPDVFAAADGELDLNRVDGPTVDAVVNVPDVSPLSMYQYSLVLDGKVAATRDFIPGELRNNEIGMAFSKQLVNITADPNGNEIFYVVGQRPGGAARSSPFWFAAYGDKGDNSPGEENRTLDPPSIKYAGAEVNSNTIEQGLTVVIPLGNPPSRMRPDAGDTLTVRLYLNGWSRNGDERHDTPERSIVYTAPVQGDSLEFSPFARQLISDYGPNPVNNLYGHIYCEYFLTKADLTEVYSKYAEYTLDTIPIGVRAVAA